MALEFDCPTCQLRIQTPDETAGKQARCPRCLTLSQIPYYSSPASAIRQSTPPAANPFTDTSSFAVAHDQHTPAIFQSVRSQFPTRAEVRRRLFIPAIGLTVMGLLGLAVTCLALAATIVHMMEDDISTDIGVAGICASMMAPPLLMLLGAFSMFRGRGSKAAWAGSLAAIAPCTIGFPLGVPFGIWGLLVLMDPLTDLMLDTKD